MIKFEEFEKEYEKEIYEFIFNTMKEELNISLQELVNSIQDLKDIKKNYIESGGNFWVAIDTCKNKIIGTVSIKINNNITEFKRYYVKKEYRNKGIGCKLYRMAEEYAKNKLISELYLVSGEELEKAHRIYKMNGWKKVVENEVPNNIYVRKGAALYKKKII